MHGKNPKKGAPKRKIDAPKTLSSAKLSWAQIVAEPAMESIPEQTKAKIAQTKKALIDAGFSRPQQKPRPSLVTVYFRNVPRGPLGTLRKALLLSLCKWTVVGFSFIGNNILEVLCHRPLVNRLVSTMAVLRRHHLDSYGPTGSNTNATNNVAHSNTCYRRWNWCALRSTSPAAKSWYSTQAQGLKDSHPSITLDSRAPSVRSEADDTSRGAKPPQPEPGSQENSPSKDTSSARSGGPSQ